LNEVIKFLKNDIFDEENLSVVVACSGGPDSMALLDVILKFKEKRNVRIICAHVNHKLRLESEQEKKDVQEYCEENKIIFEYMEIKKYNNDNFHVQARNIRYKFFDELMKKYNAKYLFTAHHGDDLIETVLMRITRGSTVNGYSGFSKITKKSNYYVVKPLICVTKQQLLEYVEENNIKYAIDKSNDKTIYTRNRYRKNMLPFLKQENKNVHLKYLKFSEQLIKYENYIQNEVNKIMPSVLSNNVLNIDLFNNLDIVIKEKIIGHILEQIYKDDISYLSDIHINQILLLIMSNKPNASINLPKGIKIIKEYNKLYFNNPYFKKQDFKILLEDEINIDNNKIKIVSESNDFSNYTIRLNKNDIKLPLYIRNINTSDKMYVKGMNGSKKIKDIYIDLKIPKEKRNRLPILVDSDDNILWLPGLKKSKYDKSKDGNCDIIIRYIEKGGKWWKRKQKKGYYHIYFYF